jgi:anthranilate synthase/aminodeoxychorismate synthase-like glutamine amidotransferase
MILLIDNYDSFVYNIARYIEELGLPTLVKRNDLSIDEIIALNPTHIIISPGPCSPNEAGVSLAAVTHFANSIPILGICLGHQAIGQAFGAKIVCAKSPTHGKNSLIWHNNEGIFKQIVSPFKVGRYHSLAISNEDLPAELIVTARTEDDEIMAVQHVVLPIYGVQFHPESILTDYGKNILLNFFKITSTDPDILTQPEWTSELI